VDMSRTPEMVIVLVDNILRGDRGPEEEEPCSMREMMGFMKIPPAQVRP